MRWAIECVFVKGEGAWSKSVKVGFLHDTVEPVASVLAIVTLSSSAVTKETLGCLCVLLAYVPVCKSGAETCLSRVCRLALSRMGSSTASLHSRFEVLSPCTKSLRPLLPSVSSILFLLPSSLDADREM